jgi:hypothetical protein
MADAIAALNLRHLAMAAELRALFDAAGAAVAGILGGTDDARGARARLLGRCGVPGALLALARLAEPIQRIERTALSSDGRSRTAAGDAGAGPMRQGAAALDVTALTTEQMAALQMVLELLDQRPRDRGLPLPSTGPVGI